jgi:hypothetical protein
LDRQLVYPGQIPLETDLLNTNRNILVSVAKLSGALVGTQTIANGLACTANSPAALNVVVGPGELYSLQNLDGTAYSSLPADTTHQIVKQGILMDAVTLSCPAPVTAGFSINYLIEAAYQDVDTTSVALPYYNATNPSQAYSGPSNTGVSQATQRKGTVVLTAKAGVAATTGTQTTPAPDAGNVGLYVVTVANGQATITSTSISTYANAPFIPSLLKVRQLANSIADPAFGAVSGSDAAASTAAAALAGQEIVFPAGTWPMSTTPTITGPHTLTAKVGAQFSGSGATALGFYTGAGQAQGQQIQMNTSGSDAANQYFRRNANHSGGTVGFVSANLRADTYVTNAGATNFEWALVGTVTNSATGGQNVGVVGYGFKTGTSVGPTFGGNFGHFETTAINNPTNGSVGCEIDNASNGTDSNGMRVILDCVAFRQAPAGAATTVTYGVRVSNAKDGANTSITNAFFVGNSDGSLINVGVAFDCGSATLSTGALRMPAGAPILFDKPGSNQLLYDGTGLYYKSGGVSASRLNADGSIQFGGASLITKITGSVATTASAGINGAPPSQVSGYLNATISGTAVKIPYYAN